MALYKLGSPYYDGSVLHKRGATIDFPDGVKPPRNSTKVGGDEPAVPTPAKPAEGATK